jgi:hypothetical protein
MEEHFPKGRYFTKGKTFKELLDLEVEAIQTG